jgi:hypothetical protein
MTSHDDALDRAIFDLTRPTAHQLRELASDLDDEERRVLLERGENRKKGALPLPLEQGS